MAPKTSCNNTTDKTGSFSSNFSCRFRSCPLCLVPDYNAPSKILQQLFLFLARLQGFAQRISYASRGILVKTHRIKGMQHENKHDDFIFLMQYFNVLHIKINCTKFDQNLDSTYNILIFIPTSIATRKELELHLWKFLGVMIFSISSNFSSFMVFIIVAPVFNTSLMVKRSANQFPPKPATASSLAGCGWQKSLLTGN